MTAIDLSPHTARARLAGLVRRSAYDDDRGVVEHYARAVWSCLVEPGDQLCFGLGASSSDAVLSHGRKLRHVRLDSGRCFPFEVPQHCVADPLVVARLPSVMVTSNGVRKLPKYWLPQTRVRPGSRYSWNCSLFAPLLIKRGLVCPPPGSPMLKQTRADQVLLLLALLQV